MKKLKLGMLLCFAVFLLGGCQIQRSERCHRPRGGTCGDERRHGVCGAREDAEVQHENCAHENCGRAKAEAEEHGH